MNESNQLATFAEGKKSAVRGGNSEAIKIQSINRFDDSEFSDYEIQLIDRIVDKFGGYDGEALIKLLHEKGGLWDRIIEANDLMPLFESIIPLTTG